MAESDDSYRMGRDPADGQIYIEAPGGYKVNVSSSTTESEAKAYLAALDQRDVLARQRNRRHAFSWIEWAALIVPFFVAVVGTAGTLIEGDRFVATTFGTTGDWFAGVAGIVAVILLVWHRHEDETDDRSGDLAATIGQCDRFLSLHRHRSNSIGDVGSVNAALAEAFGEIGRLIERSDLAGSQIGREFAAHREFDAVDKRTMEPWTREREIVRRTSDAATVLSLGSDSQSERRAMAIPLAHTA